ncbi:MAG: hypothetical protein CVV41_18575 [Candidatus Riflebacteria bacterium HGW-Riflebacteria-1]|jgi:hypothetical protein|nr:MAG: hypothetical protein CVV41_18575 [Candidatus Riflebacteria bacterium HGW-Riflebacteria-1]
MRLRKSGFSPVPAILYQTGSFFKNRVAIKIAKGIDVPDDDDKIFPTNHALISQVFFQELMAL